MQKYSQNHNQIVDPQEKKVSCIIKVRKNKSKICVFILGITVSILLFQIALFQREIDQFLDKV